MFDIDMQLQTEVDLETDGLDCHYCPHEVTVFLPAKSHKQISVLCSVIAADETFTDITADTAFDILKEREKYTKSLYETAGIHDDFADRLVLAADQFLCDRASTGYKTVLAGLPWFTDWGRDTMIAFTGLTLCTGRRKDAEEILLTFPNTSVTGSCQTCSRMTMPLRFIIQRTLPCGIFMRYGSICSIIRIPLQMLSYRKIFILI